MVEQFTGTVQSGTGRGAKFIALPVYSNIFESHLGAKPFFGTLNLKVSEAEAIIINQAFECGKVYEDLSYEGKEYGGIVIIPVLAVSGDTSIDAVAVRPHLTSHDGDIVELVATHHLREYFDLDDGDRLAFTIPDQYIK